MEHLGQYDIGEQAHGEHLPTNFAADDAAAVHWSMECMEGDDVREEAAADGGQARDGSHDAAAVVVVYSLGGLLSWESTDL